MEKENTTQNNNVKLLNADDIIDKFDLIHENKEEELLYLRRLRVLVP